MPFLPTTDGMVIRIEDIDRDDIRAAIEDLLVNIRHFMAWHRLDEDGVIGEVDDLGDLGLRPALDLESMLHHALELHFAEEAVMG